MPGKYSHIECRLRTKKEELSEPGDHMFAADGQLVMVCLCGDITIPPAHKVLQRAPLALLSIYDPKHGCSYYVERGRLIRS